MYTSFTDYDCKHINGAVNKLISSWGWNETLESCLIKSWTNHRDNNLSASPWYFKWRWHIRIVINGVIDLPERGGLYWVQLTRYNFTLGSFRSCYIPWKVPRAESLFDIQRVRQEWIPEMSDLANLPITIPINSISTTVLHNAMIQLLKH